MNEHRKTRASKRLSYVLRHGPDSIGLTLDDAGWTEVEGLLEKLEAGGLRLTNAELEEIVATSSKQRFALSEDKRRIRANQGHSVKVDLALEPRVPPTLLYHGTHHHAIESIRATGLEPRGRHHVHLSADIETASIVGARRGRLILLEIRAGDLADQGAVFFRADNGVWLVADVPWKFIKELRGGRPQ